MSKTTNDGGPAFPATVDQGCNNGWPGMTLRDYFAARAMEAATSGHISYYGHESNYRPVSDIARYAYKQADAMLEASGVQPAQTKPPRLTDEQRGALMRAYVNANSNAIKAHIPESAVFADIAQDLGWLCGEFGMKSQEGGEV